LLATYVVASFLFVAAALAATLVGDALSRERLKPDYFGKSEATYRIVMIPKQLHERLLLVVYQVRARSESFKDHLYMIDGMQTPRHGLNMPPVHAGGPYFGGCKSP
jgi:hypothetical protein